MPVHLTENKVPVPLLSQFGWIAWWMVWLGPRLCGSDLFQISVIDAGNGWPVPMVELTTIHEVRFVSDNRGIIAFDLPELMGTECWFSIVGHGYGVPKDGFGYEGVRFTPMPGGRATVSLHRTYPAQRLGRLTGAGIFSESQRFGLESQWHESGILGCDSVQIARHNGKLFWAWGDTNLPGYPLGLFHTSSATTSLNPIPDFIPPIRLTFDYFKDANQRIRNVAEMPGDGPTWISGYVSLPDQAGNHHLVASYLKVKNFLQAYEAGLCIWDENSQSFIKHRVLWEHSPDHPTPPTIPEGHPVIWSDDSQQPWLLFGDPFPKLQMPATFEAWSQQLHWQSLTPQSHVPSLDGSSQVAPHRGSIAWNPFRQKWVAIFTQLNGTPSRLGEIWYAESNSPFGKWGDAVKVASHNNYSFYNPRIHPEWTSNHSPILLFEGTFSRQFADNPHPTPRFDYNQILYRLDLNSPPWTTP